MREWHCGRLRRNGLHLLIAADRDTSGPPLSGASSHFRPRPGLKLRIQRAHVATVVCSSRTATPMEEDDGGDGGGGEGEGDDGTPSWLNGLVQGFVLPPPKAKALDRAKGAQRSQSWPRENERKRSREEELWGIKPPKSPAQGGEGSGGSSSMSVEETAAPKMMSTEEAYKQLAALAGLGPASAGTSSTGGASLDRVSPNLDGSGGRIWWQAQPSIAIKGFKLPSSEG